MAQLLMSALRHGGHEVELVSRFRSRDGRGERERQLRLRHIGQRIADRLSARWQALPLADRPEAWFTYHLYHKAPDWLGPEVSRALGIPYVVAEASHAEKQSRGPWALGWQGVVDALRRAGAVVTLNSNDVYGLRALLGKEAPLIRLPPFLDQGRVASPVRGPTRARLARTHGLCEDRPWLLAVAMLRHGDKLASYRLLAGALRKLRHVPWQLVVVGDGPARAEVRAGFAELGEDRFIMVGQADVRELAAWYAAGDLLVWPACNEAYGMALLEAQAAGLPVVAGRSGGVVDIVEDGETGLLAAEGDTVAFAAAVARLLEDDASRKVMGSAAKRKVASSHGLESAARVLDRALSVARE